MIRNENDICPKCGGRLQSRGMIKRIIKSTDGEKIFVRIPRFSCIQCHSWHVCLPDNLMPYKHYNKDIINICVRDECYDSYPCEMTIKRWKRTQK